MASTTIQGQHERIRKVIRKTAWAMLFIGIMVTAGGFAIQSEYSSVHWQECEFRVTVAETYEQYWCGFMVVATSLILLGNHKSWPQIQRHLPRICKKREFAVIMIFLSMLSGLAVMSQDGETFGRVRQYHPEYKCYEDDYYNQHDLSVKNKYHMGQILRWLYVILIASNILVVLCLVQLIAFLAVWVLEMIVKIQNPEMDSEEDPPLLPPAYELFSSYSNGLPHDYVPPPLASDPPQVHTTAYVAPQACGYIYHAPQSQQCHCCSHTLQPQANPPITAPAQHETEEERPQQQTATEQT